ncbi:MAG: ABC transporter substrate-binding protein [Deltaproteobacteria bacterium]|nr:ABC transporter substrate-binding protein [Deltaproteobacteria bacterium]
MKRENFLPATAVVLVLCLLGSAWSAEGPQKIRIGFPSLAFSYMPFYVAQEKGILQKAGLEAEYIQMRTGIQPQALINGNINFFPSVSTGLSAAVSGLPLVVVLNLYNGTPWILVAAKDLSKPQDFIGKKIAISGLKTSAHFFAQAGLKKMGLGEKEISYVVTGGTASSFAALASNQVAGAVLTPPFDDKAVSLGFKKYLFLGDLVDIPYVGMITSQAEIKGHRERVQKTIAAVMDGVSWLRSHREDSVKMIAEKFKVTPVEAERTYETMIGMFTKDGRLNAQVARGYMEVLRQDRPIPPDVDPLKLLDFSMLPGGR